MKLFFFNRHRKTLYFKPFRKIKMHPYSDTVRMRIGV